MILALIKRNTAYSLNDIVNTKYGTKLKCTTAGTTSTDPLILDGTSPITDGTVIWEVQEEGGGSGQGIVDYEANTSYNVGDIVIYDDKIYRCIIAHTSTSDFDDSKWEEISPGIASSVYATTTTLWSGAYNTVTAGTSFTLSDDYDNYDEILLMQEGQVLKSLAPSISNGVGYDGDGGNLGTNYSAHVIIDFSGTTATPVIWQYGSGLASATVYIVGRNYIKCEGYYATKDVLFSGQVFIELNAIINLTNPYTNYDYLLIEKAGSGYFCIAVDPSEMNRTILFPCYNNTIDSVLFNVLSTTQLKMVNVVNSTGDSNIYRITGIKFLPNPNDFSTTEKRIGTWIDGKPLYQKTITGTTPNTLNSEVILGTISGMETMVSIDGWIKDKYNNFIPVFYTNINNVSEKDYVCICADQTGGIRFQTGNVGYTNKYFAITVKYTKA